MPAAGRSAAPQRSAEPGLPVAVKLAGGDTCPLAPRFHEAVAKRLGLPTGPPKNFLPNLLWFLWFSERYKFFGSRGRPIGVPGRSIPAPYQFAANDG